MLHFFLSQGGTLKADEPYSFIGVTFVRELIAELKLAFSCMKLTRGTELVATR
jgi:hypothetical protein